MGNFKLLVFLRAPMVNSLQLLFCSVLASLRLGRFQDGSVIKSPRSGVISMSVPINNNNYWVTDLMYFSCFRAGGG